MSTAGKKARAAAHAGLPGALRARLRRALLGWFAREQRDLPWRRTRDPYAIWISESLLQQTRVETVQERYRLFLERFPTLGALAAAGEDEVLALWSGLGYYSRARALLSAARTVQEEHGGRLPRTREAWLALPGVGPYTAGAVLSIAHGLPEPLVDGNVARVFARLFGLEAARGSRALRERCWELARALVPTGGPDPGQWNQALMELGARVCTSRAPRCERCPLRGHCSALRAGRVQELPRPPARREPVEVLLEVFLVRRAGSVLLRQRPEGVRLARLWEPPMRELAPVGGAARLWPSDLEGLALEPGAELGVLRHAITHHRIRARVRRARLSSGARAGAGWHWVAARERERLGLTGLARKVLSLEERP